MVERPVRPFLCGEGATLCRAPVLAGCGIKTRSVGGTGGAGSAGSRAAAFALVAVAGGSGNRAAYAAGQTARAARLLHHLIHSLLHRPQDATENRAPVDGSGLQRLVPDYPDGVAGAQVDRVARSRLVPHPNHAFVHADERGSVGIFHHYFKNRAAKRDDGGGVLAFQRKFQPVLGPKSSSRLDFTRVSSTSDFSLNVGMVYLQ